MTSRNAGRRGRCFERSPLTFADLSFTFLHINFELKLTKSDDSARGIAVTIMDESLLQQAFYDTRYGKKILQCIQCGTCSASCPLTDQMDHAPREIFALIRDGEMEAVLRSNTPWYCVSCYQCMPRCPREIPVTDLMYSLKQMAQAHDMTDRSCKVPDLYDAFANIVGRWGRISEPLVMALYGVRHPGAAARNLLLAIKLFQRKRLDVHPQRIRQPEKIARLLADRD